MSDDWTVTAADDRSRFEGVLSGLAMSLNMASSDLEQEWGDLDDAARSRLASQVNDAAEAVGRLIGLDFNKPTLWVLAKDQ